MGDALVHRLVVDGQAVRPRPWPIHAVGVTKKIPADELELGRSEATPMLAVTNTSPG